MNKDDKKNAVEKVCRKVLSKVTPSEKERAETLQFSDGLSKVLTGKLQRSKIKANIHVQGSIAKDTWLAGEKDIDIFILLPKTSTREVFPKVINIVKSVAGEKWRAAYAEHPYVEAEIEGYKIDFVPSFKIDRAEEATTSVDRTPLHTSYIKKHIDHQAKDEIRLFKQFMQGIGTYGAEIKIKGFSGYLCELLILHYRSFLKTLQGIASWRFGEVIDIENLYNGRVDDVRFIFDAPLIVIDPVDANRNVAAAVSKDKLGEFITAASFFLARPDISFFFPDETIPLSTDLLDERFIRLGFDLIFIVFNRVETVPDVLWGELYKTSQAFRRLLDRNDFQVLRSAVWSDEKHVNVLVFVLESRTIPLFRRHLGPSVDSEEAASFIDKYTESDVAVIGPWIEEGRLVVGVRRKHVEAAILLKECLESGIENVGVAIGLIKSLREADVYVDREILNFYSSNREFSRFLTDLLRGRPKWMR